MHADLDLTDSCAESVSHVELNAESNRPVEG